MCVAGGIRTHIPETLTYPLPLFLLIFFCRQSPSIETPGAQHMTSPSAVLLRWLWDLRVVWLVFNLVLSFLAGW